MDIYEIIAADPIYCALSDAKNKLELNFKISKEKYEALKDSDPVFYNEMMTRLEDEHQHIKTQLDVRIARRMEQLSDNN